MLAFWIEADTFMRHMVRTLVGTMLAVASGRMTVTRFQQLLEGRAARRGGRHGGRSRPLPRVRRVSVTSILDMKVLLTNDDGIQATGLNMLRKALLEVAGVELAVIAPDSNRSATGRMITTRRPLEVQEIEFDDGTIGFATDGTPVDCVRFAALGLLEFEPELIVSGINHGANLGDDITYSGTVAAALEGIVLGIPAIAVSQQAEAGMVDFRAGRSFEREDFEQAATFVARHGRGARDACRCRTPRC